MPNKPIKGDGICYLCDRRDNLTFNTWYPIQPTAENNYQQKGADLCPPHDKQEVKKYKRGEFNNG